MNITYELDFKQSSRKRVIKQVVKNPKERDGDGDRDPGVMGEEDTNGGQDEDGGQDMEGGQDADRGQDADEGQDMGEGGGVNGGPDCADGTELEVDGGGRPGNNGENMFIDAENGNGLESGGAAGHEGMEADAPGDGANPESSKVSDLCTSPILFAK